ncbi:allantoate permease [Schizosaccharomyces japonicus yFS275]|uniref:Allantoate permease n=1 Tax=Schizosaccharomyces japonicus (strain yFS275 / FY16936) TaxID=402676 RepID=B6K1M8_SCHJY|nr:allantoate permease [Schizosaccharomyces japonicus yFS275]EEB07059.1 allantoate permease [Schizosaccharomyces japonicus yFS275]
MDHKSKSSSSIWTETNSEEKQKPAVTTVLESPIDEERGVEVSAIGEKPVADVALAILDDTNFTYTKEEAKHVSRKIDLVLMPLMALTYMIQYLDKVTLSYAALFGMNTDTHLHGSQYSWLTTIFYLGYLVAQYPGAYIMQKTGVRGFLFVNMFFWSAMVLLMAACHNFSGLATCRFFMGVFEACVSPAFVSITSMWYKRTEQPARSLFWSSFNGVAAIVGGLINFGVAHIQNEKVPTWKFTFIIIGGASIIWSVFFFFLFPSNPVTARFLTQRERRIAIERVRENRTGVENKIFKREQLWEALLDPQVWLIVFAIGVWMITNGIGAFNSIIIEALGGFSKEKTTLMNMPGGGFMIVFLFFTGLWCNYIRNGRLIIAVFGTWLLILASCLVWKLPSTDPWGRMVGMWLTYTTPITFVMLLSISASNIAGYTKKLVVNASIFCFYAVGNIVSPLLFKSSQKPTYNMGMESMLVASIVVCILCLLLMAYYNYENRRRTKLEEKELDAGTGQYKKNEEFMDYTDRQQIAFRYIW